MHQLFIGGRWLDAQDSDTLEVTNPANGKSFDRIARGRAADIDRAVSAARAALTGAWGKFNPLERGRLLVRLAEKILAHAEELAQIEASDTGKPMTTARNDIQVLARYFEFYGTAADKVHGEVIPFLNDYSVTLLREPLGVTAHIIPWNYPAQMFGRSVAPALAMGNAVVVKPAEDTSLSTLRIAALAAEVGFPAGALNVVTGLGHEAGAALAAHPGINYVSFTGSNEVGTLIQQAAAVNAVPCTLELGGKSAQIVFDDCNIERAVPIIVRAIVQNAGQTCTAGSRLLVQKNIYDEVIARVAERFSTVRVGTPEMDLDCGPLMNAAQLARVTRYVDDAISSGVPVLAQGQHAEGLPSGGFYTTPVMFGPVPRDARLACEEVFGPVLSVMPFSDEADAIALANATPYGLLAAVWSESGGRQQRVSKAVEAGQVFVNSYGAGGGVELPFGGTKRSGHGREKGLLALEECSSTKTVVVYHGD